MVPSEAPQTSFPFAQPPPGFFRGPSLRTGAPPSPTEQDPMLLHHISHVSRAKLDDMGRSRKGSGLLKQILIQNLSRSYEDLVSELVTEEREDGYDEIVIQHELQRRTAEEMWLDACLQDLDDEDDDEDDEGDVDDSMYYASYSADDLSVADSPPALSPDMPSMDESELELEDDDVDGMTPPPLMDFDISRDARASYFEFSKREELAAFQKMRFPQARREREVEEWTIRGWVV